MPFDKRDVRYYEIMKLFIPKYMFGIWHELVLNDPDFLIF